MGTNWKEKNLKIKKEKSKQYIEKEKAENEQKIKEYEKMLTNSYA